MLKPGESRAVSVRADPRLLADFNPRARRWEVRPGRVRVELAKSAVEPVLTAQVVLTAQKIKP
jgi:beta-glucosidase